MYYEMYVHLWHDMNLNFSNCNCSDYWTNIEIDQLARDSYREILLMEKINTLFGEVFAGEIFARIKNREMFKFLVN